MIQSSLLVFFRSYGYRLFLFLGALSMLVLLLLRRRQYELSKVKAVLFSILLLCCGILGAKLLYFLESGASSFSGMSFFGAVFLVPVIMPLVGYVMKLKPSCIPDLCAPCVASIIMFMRFGCLCAGCCGGVYSSLLGMCWPTQLMESIGDMVILFVLIYLEQKGRRGILYPVFLISYGAMRFLLEFLRDTPKEICGFSNGQLFAVAALILGLLPMLFARLNGGKKR